MRLGLRKAARQAPWSPLPHGHPHPDPASHLSSRPEDVGGLLQIPQPPVAPDGSRTPRSSGSQLPLILEGFSCREGASCHKSAPPSREAKGWGAMALCAHSAPWTLRSPPLLTTLGVKQGAGPSLLRPGRDACPWVQVLLYQKHGGGREEKAREAAQESSSRGSSVSRCRSPTSVGLAAWAWTPAQLSPPSPGAHRPLHSAVAWQGTLVSWLRSLSSP